MIYAEFVTATEHFNYVLGMCFFSFLLYCLLFRTRHDLGTYRYLQILMVIIDAAYNSVQMFIQERMLTANCMWAMIPTSKYGITAEIICLYLAIYNLTFVMIDYSFLYRMWAIKSPLRIALFSNPLFIILLCAIACIESVVWFSSCYFLYPPTDSGRVRLRESTLLDFGIDTTSHVMIMGDYFREDGTLNIIHLCGTAALFSVMTICFGFMAYAFFEIMHYLKTSKLISKTSIRLQRQLLITLCLQTIIPLICLYSPCGVMIILPLLGINSYYMARATPLLICCFLPLDTLAVILSMADYRREVDRILRFVSFRTTNNTVVSVERLSRDRSDR